MTIYWFYFIIRRLDIKLPIKAYKNFPVNITIDNHRYIIIDTFLIALYIIKTMIVINTPIIATCWKLYVTTEIHYSNGEMTFIFDNRVPILKHGLIIVPPRNFTFGSQWKIFNINRRAINPDNTCRPYHHPGQPNNNNQGRDYSNLKFIFTKHCSHLSVLFSHRNW
ncbi:Uncharacterised protein [Serratia plymuthica]|uniref:Uncharacterized protein n=1 Tax=Serratia plymuthica TaxID=82996 RepID=A0A2X4UXH4_SERPL|nr:Uncharacterised protein [Serratia plymuthica]SQI44586.1 Uncharacterised protein [Serratia plymuthica]